MKIVPVLDVMHGRVVHGVGGRRADYAPIRSRWTDSAVPVTVAEALRRHFGFTEFYLADLDAISGAEPAFPIYEDLQKAGCVLWVDAGIADATRAFGLGECGVARIIAGLETLAGPHVPAEMIRSLGGRTIFSLDLRGGTPLRASNNWSSNTWEILEQAIAVGIRSVLLLDLARVGMRQGTGTEELIAKLSAAHPQVEIIAGGGIRHVEDLRRLEGLGVQAVLMATALHDGSITPADL